MFTWKPIYQELATCILQYRDNRTKLLDILSEAKTSGLNMFKLIDQNPKGTDIPLADVDPFTFFASFNRGISNRKRQAILGFFKNKFGLKSQVPDDFHGSPTMMVLASWFFSYKYERAASDIDVLWDMAEAIINTEPDKIDPSLFAKCLGVRGSGIASITMALFWFRPDTYIALDSKNRDLLKLYDKALKDFNYPKLSLPVSDWESYLMAINNVRSTLDPPDFARISHEAHLIATGQQSSDNLGFLPKCINKGGIITIHYQNYPLNTILYGPPGTGKTYSSIIRAVEIIDGIKLDKDYPYDKIKNRFDELTERQQINFITFHQSFSYEDFVEGIRPVIGSGDTVNGASYEYRDGLFKRICALAKTPRLVSGSNTDIDFEEVRIWKMSLGNTELPEDDHIYLDCISGNFIAHGSGRGQDFSECKNKSDIEEALKVEEWKNWSSTLTHNVQQIVAFKLEMQIGDLVVISDGNRKFRAIGSISGGYTYNKKYTYNQQRSVTWLRVFEESQPVQRIMKDKVFSRLTLYPLSPETLRLDALRDLLSTRSANPNEQRYVLIIDEINRGNISKILGELITLLEEDKRLGAKSELQVRLPYSQEMFGIPRNLYVLGTMNTADKSIALVDIALRRRFIFEELMPDFSFCKSLTDDMKKVMNELNHRIVLRKDRDHQIGHSYFIEVSNTETFNEVFIKSTVPLLQEYFWNDWDGLRFVLGEESNEDGKFIRLIPNCDKRAARNKWEWFSDAGEEAFDYLTQLQSNYSTSS